MLILDPDEIVVSRKIFIGLDLGKRLVLECYREREGRSKSLWLDSVIILDPPGYLNRIGSDDCREGEWLSWSMCIQILSKSAKFRC